MNARLWRRWRVQVAMGLASGLGMAVAMAQAPEPPPPARRPVELFASLPLLSNLTISPDGTKLAGLLNQGDHTLVITRPVNGEKVTGVLANDNQEFHVRWVHWVGNDRLLVSVSFASRRYFVGTVETRLLSVKADGTDPFALVKNPSVRGGLVGGRRTQQIQDQVVDWMPDDGQHVLLQLPDPERVLPAVYKVNVATGARSMVKAPERHVYRWMADHQHRVRVGIREVEQTTEVRVADPDGKQWRTAWSWTTAKDAVRPIGFGVDPQELYVLADHEGRDAVFTVRLDDPALALTLQSADPDHDMSGGLVRLPSTGAVIGVRAAADDSEEVSSGRETLWDPTWRAQMQAVDRGLPDRVNDLRQISRDDQRYLVLSSGNGKPGVYYLGDRRTGSLAEIGATYPDLEPTSLVGKHSTKITARDGLDLRAFLTLPRGRRQDDGGAPLPLVLLPHGGPHGRDSIGFDIETEFLADRGYAVLQVNFRGSSGYGHEFESAGLKRWGLEMQDDLTDAVQWAVARKVADPSRVCIVGGSYGGYAALMGAVKTPELYRCAVSFAGVSDLPDLVQHWSDYVLGLEAMDRMVGRVWGDRERLRVTSPARQAERIQAPVLLVHGTSDRVVPVDQSETMAKALRRAGKPHRYVELEQGDHHLSRYTHRLLYFKALEAFLDEHLQVPKPQPSGS